MKTIKLLTVFLLFSSCSKDEDCEGNYTEIYNKYQTQINFIMNNPVGGVVDQVQLAYVIQERDKKLQNACR